MAVPSESVAVKVLRVRSQDVTDTLFAHASDSVAPESGLAVLAVSALRVEETLETAAGVGIAVAGVVVVPVVTAVAWDAGAAGNFRISVKIVSTHGATESCKHPFEDGMVKKCLIEVGL